MTFGTAHIDFEQNLWTLVPVSDANDLRQICLGFHSLDQAKARAASMNYRVKLSNRAIVKSVKAA